MTAIRHRIKDLTEGSWIGDSRDVISDSTPSLIGSTVDHWRLEIGSDRIIKIDNNNISIATIPLITPAAHYRVVSEINEHKVSSMY